MPVLPPLHFPVHVRVRSGTCVVRVLCLSACVHVRLHVSTRKMPAQPHPPCGKGRLILRPHRSAIGRLRSGAVASPCNPSCVAGSAVGAGISRPAHSVSACAWTSATRRLSARMLAHPSGSASPNLPSASLRRIPAHPPCFPSAPCIRICTAGRSVAKPPVASGRTSAAPVASGRRCALAPMHRSASPLRDGKRGGRALWSLWPMQTN